jgi:GAF domain-containing protein
MTDHQQRDVAEILVAYARTLSDDQSVESIFLTLGDYCTQLLGVDGIGILLLEEGDLVVATTNSKRGEAVEHLEAELAEGPCTDAIRSSQPVLAPDLEAVADRWPNFAPRALRAGVRGIHGIPIGGRGQLPIGSLNIVTAEPRVLTDADLAIADMLADVAVSYMIGMRATEQATELASQLQRALDSRVVIEQAKGILAGRHGYSLTDAFERIRRHSRSNNEQVRHVARRICDGDLDLR